MKEVRAGLLPAGASFCCGDGRSGCSSGEGGVNRRTIQNFDATSDEPALLGGDIQMSAGPPARPALAGANAQNAGRTSGQQATIKTQQKKPHNRWIVQLNIHSLISRSVLPEMQRSVGSLR